MRVFVAVAVMAVGGLAQAGDVYRWVDSAGKVHYGDQPKQGAEQVNVAPPPPSVPPESPEAEAARNKQCTLKTAQLASYRKAASIKETDALGKAREYSAQEREQLLSLTEQQMKEACSPPTAAAAATPTP